MATMKAEQQKPQKEESNPEIKSQNKISSESISPDSTSSDPKPETLPSFSSNTASSYPSFSKLLEGVVMAANSAISSAPSVKTVESQGQLGMSHQEALVNITAKATQGNPQMQVQAESAKSLITPLLNKKVEEHEIRKGDSSCNPDKRPDDVPRTPKSDGYGWRKYGQKQVKSSGSSRSYYRCTYISCFAKKKVQHLDVSGEVIDVVYEGDHNHDPPQILKGSNRKKDSTSRTLYNSSDSSVQTTIDAPHFITCDRELKQLVSSAHECQDRKISTAAGSPPRDVEERDTKTVDTISRSENELAIVPVVAEHGGSRSENSDERTMIDPMKEPDVAPLKKRRLKGTGKACSESVYRTFKEPKVVVHAVGDVGLPSDGYRWRKYGQKMVKGTPHPRSYYRCSSTGCPARKHVERATDDSTAILVTYEGKHDHDVPVVKRHNHVTSPNATASDANVVSDSSENKLSAPEQSKDLDSDPKEEKASELGGDKVLESARTLLSIGIELKSC